MKSKLDLAHEYYISKINAGDEIVTVKEAWAYADAMYEQHEKRSPPAKSIADIAREINQNIKEDGQKIVDKQKALLDDVEWQPDWSVAPDWATAWSHDRLGSHWWDSAPKKGFDMWIPSNSNSYKYDESPDFNYQGHWRDSLRKRPK